MNGYGNKDLYTETRDELQKMEDSVREEENKIDDCYKRIGKLYYSVYADKNDVDRDFIPLITSVKTSLENIAFIRECQLKLKDMIKCRSCGAEIPAFSAFCNVCGVPVKMETEPETEAVVEKTEEFQDLVVEAEKTVKEKAEMIVCQNCGAILPEDSAFCTECGAKVNAFEEITDNEKKSDATGLLSTEQISDAVVDTENENMEEKQCAENSSLSHSEKLCKYCGAVIEDDCMFCTQCGKLVNSEDALILEKEENTEPTEAQDKSKESELEEEKLLYMPTVGETMVLSADFAVKKCECGAVFEADAMFCTECGKPVKHKSEPFNAKLPFNPCADVVKGTEASGKCKSCGTVLEADSAFCTECGTPVKKTVADMVDSISDDDADDGVIKCSNCNTPFSEDAKRCNKCGKPVFDSLQMPGSSQCHKCGATFRGSLMKCPKCNAKLV